MKYEDFIFLTAIFRFIYKINAFIYTFLLIFSYSFYSSQKKTLEINTRHPLIKELKSKIEVSIFAAFI